MPSGEDDCRAEDASTALSVDEPVPGYRGLTVADLATPALGPFDFELTLDERRVRRGRHRR